MGNLIQLHNKLDPQAKTCRALVETPKGSRAKLDYNPKYKVFFIKSLLPDGMSFPLDFGFIPSTLAGDGDPLDVMVLMDQPCPTGSMLDVRLLGVIEAEEVENGRTERNDRLLAAGAVSRLYETIRTADDLGDEFIRNLVSFWTNKADLEGKQFTCLRVGSPDDAVKLVQKGMQLAKTQSGKKA